LSSTQRSLSHRVGEAGASELVERSRSPRLWFRPVQRGLPAPNTYSGSARGVAAGAWECLPRVQETHLYPHAVPLKESTPSDRRSWPVGRFSYALGSGEGQGSDSLRSSSWKLWWERRRVSNPSDGLPDSWPWTLLPSTEAWVDSVRVLGRARPVVAPVVRRAHPPPSLNQQ